jgi:hypothetical protein
MAAWQLWAALAVDKYSSGGICLESVVPKDAEKKDVFDAVTSVMPDLTYLSLTVKVSPVKMTNCLLPMPG